jgi:hypothetical protein
VGEELVEGVEDGRESEHAKQPAQWPDAADLGNECEASAPIACHWSTISKHDPPTHVAPLFGNSGEQAIGFRVR